MSRIKFKFFSLLYVTVFFLTDANAANILWNGETLSNNAYISSSNGKYSLVMQVDGSLVMYRSDGSVRYAMAQGGNIAVMQDDGNFVQYRGTSTLVPIWDAGTGGNPLASSVLQYYLFITEDGNLVIVQEDRSDVITRSRTLWEIGPDKSPIITPPPATTPSVYPMEKLSPPGSPPSNVPPRLNRPERNPYLQSNGGSRY